MWQLQKQNVLMMKGFACVSYHSFSTLEGGSLKYNLDCEATLNIITLISLATYKMSEKGQLCSNDDHYGILELEECKKAVNGTQYIFRDTRHMSHFPKGCYFDPIFSVWIYFNTATPGRPNPDIRQVCKYIGKCSF